MNPLNKLTPFLHHSQMNVVNKETDQHAFINDLKHKLSQNNLNVNFNKNDMLETMDDG